MDVMMSLMKFNSQKVIKEVSEISIRFISNSKLFLTFERKTKIDNEMKCHRNGK